MSYCARIILLISGVLFCAPVFVSAQNDQPAPPGLTIHVVQRGENLFGISQQYGMSIDDLAQLNGLLDVNSIQVGQRLLVPDGTMAAEPSKTHIVQPGETLSSIARLYNADIATLVEINNIPNANQIYPGQELKIYRTGVSALLMTLTPIPPGPDNGLTTLTTSFHEVQEGETLFQIGLLYGLTVQELAVANGIEDPTAIVVGQQLIIPGYGETLTAALDLPAPLTAIDVSPLIFVEGETSSIVLQTSVPSTLAGRFLGRELNIIPLDDGLHHVMIVPVPLFTDGGIYPIQFVLANSDGTRSDFAFNLMVISGAYETQDIEVSPEMQQLLAPAVQENEITILQQLTGVFNTERYFSDPFSLPAAAAMNEPFGTRRSYDGGAISSYHSGIDFAAPPDAPVYAAAPGKVVLADTLNIRGNTVVISHGWGVYSVYAHQNTLNVSVGDIVSTGQVIGTAGATGRVTGPHLHWEIWVDGVAVNPVQWTQRTFP